LANGDQQLFTVVRDYLVAEASRAPLVVVLEDVHWADPGSFEMLRRLARDARTLPVLLVATYRTDEVDRRHMLYSMLRVLVREAQPIRLEVRALDHATVRSMHVAGLTRLRTPFATACSTGPTGLHRRIRSAFDTQFSC